MSFGVRGGHSNRDSHRSQDYTDHRVCQGVAEDTVDLPDELEGFPRIRTCSSIAIEGSATYDLKSESDHHVDEHRVLLADHPADKDVQDTPDHQTAEKSRADVSAIVTSTSYLHDVGDGPASDRKLDSDVDECQKAARWTKGVLAMTFIFSPVPCDRGPLLPPSV